MGAGDTLAVVVTNRIPVADGHEEEFEERFSRRVHLVDRAPGFLRNEVHRPRPKKFSHATGKWEDDTSGQAYYEVKTWWRSMADFEAWTRSPAFAEAHNSMPPRDMFAGASQIVVSEAFLSTDLASKTVSPEELARFRGEGGAPIFVGLCGKVYDVSASAGFYGPGGAYHVFAGRDASRALAKGLLDETLVMERPGDLSDLSGAEQNKLDEWTERFESKYPIVGVLAGGALASTTSAAGRAKPQKQPRAFKKTVVVDPKQRSKL